MKILVVEDEKYSRLSILKQLASISELQDISLLSAEDGKQGLEVFLTEKDVYKRQNQCTVNLFINKMQDAHPVDNRKCPVDIDINLFRNVIQRRTVPVVNICLLYTSSNGSTSQGSICGSTLALMDAGVPIKAPVAGISCGLITEGERWMTMVDIQGLEDFFGDMDLSLIHILSPPIRYASTIFPHRSSTAHRYTIPLAAGI